MKKDTNGVLVIGIAGGSGSGKTTLATEIAKQLNDEAILLSHDNYYKANHDLSLCERANINYDEPCALETSLLIQNIKDLCAGQTVEVPLYDFSIHDRKENTIVVTPKRAIIVEGILIFENEELRRLFDLTIFVDTDADVRLCRRIKRDVKKRGRKVEDVVSQYIETVKPMHEKYCEPTKRYASIIVRGGGKDKNVQKMIINYITNVGR